MSAGLIAEIVDEGLGNSSYLVHLGDRRALVGADQPVVVVLDPFQGRAEVVRQVYKIGYEAAGHRDLSVVVGGAADWATASGRPLKSGR